MIMSQAGAPALRQRGLNDSVALSTYVATLNFIARVVKADKEALDFVSDDPMAVQLR